MKEEKNAEIDVTKTCGVPAPIFNSVLIAFRCRSLLATPVSHFCLAVLLVHKFVSQRLIVIFRYCAGGK